MNYLYTGARFDTALAKTDDVEELLNVTGANTGNLLIGDALRRHLDIKSQFLLRGFHPNHASQIEKEYDAIVIGAANFLREGMDLGQLANIIEKIQLPCVIIGLGAQSPDYSDKINLSEGTTRLVKIISERSKFLGVRGYYTAYVLNDMGIKNVRPVGCPSMYWTQEPAMKIHKKAFRDCKKFTLNGSTNVVSHSSDMDNAQRVEHWLARLSYQHQYPYILQNELYEMKILQGTTYEPLLLSNLKKIHGLTDISSQVFEKHIKNNMRVFFDIASWMRFISEFDFVLGTRFHGTLMGLLSGVPSFLFVHDSRTREMAEFLDVPHIDIRKVGTLDLHKLYEETDLKTLDVKYQYLYKNYVEFLDENGLAHTFPPLV